MDRFFIVGGAGFIGSHFVDRLLADPSTAQVTIYDNLSSGRRWHFEPHLKDSRFAAIVGDAKELDTLSSAMTGHETVIHLASNPDIAKGLTTPDIDFYEGTLLTQNVVEAARISGVKTILYASGSGVYGDLGLTAGNEEEVTLRPINTYGASKLAGEALISAYSHMFNLRGVVFRFGNVVGPRQTHGIGFDFARRLLEQPTILDVLGDGTQSKSYIHVADVIDAVLLAYRDKTRPFDVYNVATGDYITVTEIAELALECLGLTQSNVEIRYAGGDRGWKGDIPIVRLNTQRISALGWRCRRSSRQALDDAMRSMIEDFRSARM
jgi:UDP-glucose 4-epimerase